MIVPVVLFARVKHWISSAKTLRKMALLIVF